MNKKYYAFFVKGSRRNKILRFLIFYSKRFHIYEHTDKYWLKKRYFFGNKNQKNSNEEYLNNIKDVTIKLIILEPNDVLNTLLLLKPEYDKTEALINLVEERYGKNFIEPFYFIKNNFAFGDITSNPIKSLYFIKTSLDDLFVLEEYR